MTQGYKKLKMFMDFISAFPTAITASVKYGFATGTIRAQNLQSPPAYSNAATESVGVVRPVIFHPSCIFTLSFSW